MISPKAVTARIQRFWRLQEAPWEASTEIDDYSKFTIEPRMSQSGKTRYRGCFISRAFGLVYQKPSVIRFRSDLPETLSDPIERNDFEVRAERSRAERPDTEDTREAYTILAYCFY